MLPFKDLIPLEAMTILRLKIQKSTIKIGGSMLRQTQKKGYFHLPGQGSNFPCDGISLLS